MPTGHKGLSDMVRRAHLALELSDRVVELKVVTSGIARKHTPACMQESSESYTAAQQKH